MISSPCKNCPKKNLPKDICLKDCRLLKIMQNLQISTEGRCASVGIDYTEETRYTIPLSLAKIYESP